jgi:predicted nucleic acid-binding protein
VPDAWDTSVASRAYANGRHVSLLDAHVSTRTPIPLPAPAVQEVARGLAARSANGRSDARHLRWLFDLVAHPLVEVLPLGVAGAVLAGRLLALLPHPPTGPQRRRGTRAQQRAAWALDVQIAACAFAGGYGVLTENVADFGVLRAAIGQLVPDVPPLVVRDARELAAAAT